MGHTVLAFGAAGHFVGLVVPELAKQGAKIRAFASDSKQADTARERDANEVAVGDPRNRESLGTALEGVDRVFYIAPAFLADEAMVGKSVVGAAVKAGMRRFVFSSVIHPVLSGLPITP